MIALNNTSIFIGQIKQVLKDFNLPLCNVGNKNLSINSYYLDPETNKIYYRYKNKNNAVIDKYCYDYDYNSPFLNVTTNFKIENMLYDRATHEYLGKYLRFLRDYNKIDLMSMYNCFDGNLLENDVEFTLENNKEVEFKVKSEEYVVYKLPISLVNTYSISLHNTKTIEVCLFDESDVLKSIADQTKFNLSKETYAKARVKDVFYYEPDIKENIVPNNLFLLIKIPKDLHTSIVVLEGKFYAAYNGLNILPIGDEINIKTASQLLSTENTYGDNLLGDRLLEYLTGAAIYKLSEPYDIKRLQVSLDRLYSENIPLEERPAISKVKNRFYGV